MSEFIYDDIKDDLDMKAKLYSSDRARDIRFTISKLQSDLAYYQYRISLIQEKISELDKKYQFVIGVAKDETVKKV